ncbi:hypothetical protein BJX63DRAFT_166032 [Aspergillus granulosus]|uniref:Uncharacterized protein n=1 Tax=Aspergillus granulosus TaxID=176169 RepID=A0ABR4HKU3_9EURO
MSIPGCSVGPRLSQNHNQSKNSRNVFRPLRTDHSPRRLCILLVSFPFAALLYAPWLLIVLVENPLQGP